MTHKPLRFSLSELFYKIIDGMWDYKCLFTTIQN